MTTSYYAVVLNLWNLPAGSTSTASTSMRTRLTILVRHPKYSVVQRKEFFIEPPNSDLANYICPKCHEATGRSTTSEYLFDRSPRLPSTLLRSVHSSYFTWTLGECERYCIAPPITLVPFVFALSCHPCPSYYVQRLLLVGGLSLRLSNLPRIPSVPERPPALSRLHLRPLFRPTSRCLLSFELNSPY